MKTKKIFYDIIDESGKRNYCILYHNWIKEIKKWSEYEITETVNNKMTVKTFKGKTKK